MTSSNGNIYVGHALISLELRYRDELSMWYRYSDTDTDIELLKNQDIYLNMHGNACMIITILLVRDIRVQWAQVSLHSKSLQSLLKFPLYANENLLICSEYQATECGASHNIVSIERKIIELTDFYWLCENPYWKYFLYIIKVVAKRINDKFTNSSCIRLWGGAGISVIFFFFYVNLTRWCSIAWNRVLIRRYVRQYISWCINLPKIKTIVM